MEEKQKGNKKQGMNSFIGGMILTDERVTKQIPFILFLAFLGIMLITTRNCSEKTIRKITVLQDSVDNLRSESVIFSSKLMDLSKLLKIKKQVEKAGIQLDEPVRPPRKIYVDK